jgi:hypothetical protein
MYKISVFLEIFIHVSQNQHILCFSLVRCYAENRIKPKQINVHGFLGPSKKFGIIPNYLQFSIII